jgi:hypothetical protein
MLWLVDCTRTCPAPSPSMASLSPLPSREGEDRHTPRERERELYNVTNSLLLFLAWIVLSGSKFLTRSSLETNSLGFCV